MLGLSPVPCPPTPHWDHHSSRKPLLLPFLAHTPLLMTLWPPATPQPLSSLPSDWRSKPIPACFEQDPSWVLQDTGVYINRTSVNRFSRVTSWKEFVWTLGQNTRKPLESILKMLALHSPQPWGDPVKLSSKLYRKQSFSSYRVLSIVNGPCALLEEIYRLIQGVCRPVGEARGGIR